MGQTPAREVGKGPTPEAIEESKQKVKTMSVKELRMLLGKNHVDFSGCFQKEDLQEKALQLADQGKAVDPAAPPKPPKGEFLCCFEWLLPAKAPAWYTAKLGGKGSSGDCHDKPAPEGSLFALGHIELRVPDGPLARTFYETGLGFVKSSRGGADEVWLNAGPSQIQLKVSPNAEADRWPGEVRVWVDNIQTTYDHMAVTDGELHIKCVSEYLYGINGGEFAMKVLDPFAKTFYVMTEAPKGRKDAIQKIGCESASMKSNVLALSDLSIKCKSRADTQLYGEFYKQFFGAEITVLQYETMVHFAPGPGLHQTITFKEDPSMPPATNLASLCFYVADQTKLKSAFEKCRAANIVESPTSWQEAQNAKEFIVKGMVDPNTNRVLMPMRNIIRTAQHPECLVYS